MLHVSRLVLLAFACFASAPSVRARMSFSADRTAEQIVADATVAQRALAEAGRLGGKTSAGFKASARHLCALVGELRTVDPAHAELARWLPRRWELLTQVLGEASAVDAELVELLAKEPNGALDWPARSMLVRARMELARGSADSAVARLGEAFEDVVKRYGDKPEIADLFFDYAESRRDDPKLHASLMKRFVEKFPKHKEAVKARERAEQLGRVGSEFVLEFKDALTGKQVATKDLRGKVLVVDFWATWCAPCMRDMPRMKSLYAKYEEQGVEFLGVSLDKPEAEGGLQALLNVCESQGMTWPQYYQGNYWQSEFSSSWGIRRIPAVFLVDFEGKLVTTSARGQLETLIPQELERAKAAKK
ncbi:MAG: redoxin domain-containing protein [Planctomycetes bacterium]|nr:redoxin domain-containing protein [Planctomycetota bacterium]